MTTSGDLRERVRFDPPATTAGADPNSTPGDALGNLDTGGFDTTRSLTRWAHYIMRPGSEAMTEARLSGKQPVTMVVRYDSQTSTIANDWRVTDLRTLRIYNIQAAEDMDRKRQWWTLVCVAGEDT